MMKYYKALDYSEKPSYASPSETWSLPKDDQPGDWMPGIEDIEPYKRGYHLCERGDLVYRLGPVIYVAEGRGEMIRDETLTVFSEARLVERLNTWTTRVKHLFAADCAERVLHIYEGFRPDDSRPRNAIEAARLLAKGEISHYRFNIVSREAYGAGWEAAIDPNSAAVFAAHAAAQLNAEQVAWLAIRSIEWGAINSRDDVTAERKWQTERLFEYLTGKR